MPWSLVLSGGGKGYHLVLSVVLSEVMPRGRGTPIKEGEGRSNPSQDRAGK